MFKVIYSFGWFVIYAVINDAIGPIKNIRVVIVGGGAAGFFSAIECASTLKIQNKIGFEVFR